VSREVIEGALIDSDDLYLGIMKLWIGYELQPPVPRSGLKVTERSTDKGEGGQRG
jgi:hypothetical protein